MEKLIKIFNKHNGFARMQEMRNNAIHPRDIAKAVFDGIIEKVKPGLYKLVDYPWDEHSSFADVCNAHKKAVICLTSAVEYYKLTTYNPSYITVAVPHNTPSFKLEYPPIQVYFFKDTYYETGIEDVLIQNSVHAIFRSKLA